MISSPKIRFNDGHSIPQLGLGVWQTPADQAAEVLRTAFRAGYRHIDTAAAYNNEEGVGEGVRSSELDRSEIFVTTKLQNAAQGYDSTLRAFDQSLKRLGLDYVDLYLIHWPVPKKDLYAETWKAFVRLQEEKRVRSIGVSNFTEQHLERIIGESGVTPVLNQIELHPDFQQHALRQFHAQHDIKTESWSPLSQGKLLKNDKIADIARKHGKTAAQIIIRWHIDNGLIVIPKSATPSRIKENIDVFDFQLTDEDMQAIATLDDKNARIGSDPMTANF